MPNGAHSAGVANTPSTARDMGLRAYVQTTPRRTQYKQWYMCDRYPWCTFGSCTSQRCMPTSGIGPEGVPVTQCTRRYPRGCDVPPLRPVVELERALIHRPRSQSSIGIPRQHPRVPTVGCWRGRGKYKIIVTSKKKRLLYRQNTTLNIE